MTNLWPKINIFFSSRAENKYWKFFEKHSNFKPATFFTWTKLRCRIAAAEERKEKEEALHVSEKDQTRQQKILLCLFRLRSETSDTSRDIKRAKN